MLNFVKVIRGTAIRIGVDLRIKEFSSINWGSKKVKKLKKITTIKIMADQKVEAILTPLREDVQSKGSIVRQLKADGAPELDIKKAVAELKAAKKILEDTELQLTHKEVDFDRPKMEDLLKRRFFYDQSFAIYGGVSGQYDFGPMGCAIKSNVLQLWRRFFIIEDQMLEVDCSILTPEPVLKASGHVDRFADLLVKDMKNGECFRLDHLIKNSLEKLKCDKNYTGNKSELDDIIVKLDGMTKQEMTDVLKKYNIKSPNTGNELSEPVEFNLMFSTQIGPTGLVKGFLRPETAQGIFVNFKRLLEFNQGKLPFGVAQIGNAFRNEISPRSGLIRVREFTMAEIEYFCDPKDKAHKKFAKVKDTEMLFYSACNQMSGESAVRMTIGAAVEKGIVANETLAYFMTRIHEFLITVGIKNDRVRFRQHMNNEMAHYACDCWDAECLTSYGWIECVGCADRSAYDLTQHSMATGIKLAAEKSLPAPKTVQVKEVMSNKQLVGKTFKKDSKIILDTLSKLNEEQVLQVEKELQEKSSYDLVLEENKITLTSEMISIKESTKTVHVEDIIPNVIEPSFGIGRIIYALFEQTFSLRDDNLRSFFSLPAIVAPIKCSVLPLTSNKSLDPFVKQLADELSENGLAYKVDDASGSIGRRYARTDEISIPYGITVDFDTLESPNTVTLRERDSMSQVRIPVTEVIPVVKKLADGKISWVKIQETYPKFEVQESSK